MKIRRRNHPEGHVARGKNNPSPTRGARTKSGALRVHPRDKMGRVYAQSTDGGLVRTWGALYNHNGEEINPVEIQAKIDERTAMTSWVRSGQSTTIELGKKLFLTVDDRGKQPTVFLHTSKDLTHTQRFPKGIKTMPNLKAARRYARELLDDQPITKAA